MGALIEAVGETESGDASLMSGDEIPRLLDERNRSDYDRQRKRVRMHPAQREAFNGLDIAIRGRVQRGYDEGYRDGSSILGKLVEGSTTLIDFEAHRDKAAAALGSEA